MPGAVRIIDQFIELSDTPASFSGEGLKVVRVNAGGTALEFATATGGTPGGSDTQMQYNNAGAFGGAAGFVYTPAASPNVSIQAQNAAYIAQAAKAAASQTADIIQVQNSSGASLAGFDKQGRIFSHLGTSPTNFFAGDADVGKTTASGTYNVGIGGSTLKSLTSGSNNFAFGFAACNSLTTGAYNFALGPYALQVATGAQYNVLIGYVAGRYITGDFNIGVGSYSLGATTSGANNVAIGYNAGKFNQTGANNTSIGNYSLQGVATNSNANNTAIGNSSGFGLTTGGSNIFLGFSSGYRQTTNSNLLIIDNQQRADAATEATNAILYGVMAAAPADQDLTINANLFLPQVKSGATQVAAGAAAGEVWKTASHASLPDNVLMIGV